MEDSTLGLSSINTKALSNLHQLRVITEYRTSGAKAPQRKPDLNFKVHRPVPTVSSEESMKKVIVNKLLGNYVTGCDNISVDFKSPHSIVPFITCCLKSIDQRLVHSKVISDLELEPMHVDWEWVLENLVQRQQNLLGDSSNWLLLFESVTFDDAVESVVDSMACVHMYRKTFRKVGFVGKYELSIKNICSIYLLLNIIGLTGSHVLERFLDTLFEENNRSRALEFTSSISDNRYTTEDYNDAAIGILCHINLSDAFVQDVQNYLLNKSDIHRLMKQKEIEMQKGRPKLRTMVSRKDSSDACTAMGSMNSYDAWLTFVKFPNTSSKKTKNIVYLLMSIPDINYRELVEQCIPKDLAMMVIKVPITMPEVGAINTIIANTHYRNQAFEEMAKFRAECFTTLSVKYQKELTLTTLFRLYLSAYQYKHIWKEVWRNVLPVLSFPIIQSVEQFVKQNPINEREVLKALLY